ncbi:hypothetical protein Pcinc_017910 [Petrolisthes cinctipes]|uniref:Uncharacterized protein n=1 Tax=Petrolisthes cinctipes TaxID=88211 RepID=A0AAE1FNB8_PETCI|nr:hypothetical protein Pcinc_017910 [Petrolisthes cinctipes]
MTVDKLTLLHLKNLCLMLVKMEVELTYTAVYVQQSSFIEDVPEPHPHADFYALHQEPVAEITISEIGGGVDLHNSLQEFSVAEVTPVPHPDHTYLCTSQDGADFGQPADVGIQIVANQSFATSKNNLAKRGEVTVSPTFKQEITAEAYKTRGSYNSEIIEKRHIEAAKQLKADKNITIRKSDKAATYVIMDTSEYLTKLDTILGDETKFTKISRNPIDELKRKVNKLITSCNKFVTTHTQKLSPRNIRTELHHREQ